MKKLLIICLFMVTLFGFRINVSALCYDDDLNEWVVNADIKFIKFDRYLTNEETGEILGNTMEYAYILTTTTQREDIVLKAKADYGGTLEGMYIPGHKVYGIPDYNPKYGAKYEISIYGAENSACPGELLKTLDYEVEQFNSYYKTQYCEEYPDAPLCVPYKDTSDVSYDEFKQSIEEYAESLEEEKEDTWFTVFMKFMVNYGLYVLIPFVLIVLIYMIKIGKIKKIERKK